MKNVFLRIAVLALLLYALVCFSTALVSLRELEERREELQTDIALLESDNERLGELIDKSDSDEAIRALARERLGLVMPGEIVFIFKETERENDGA